MSSVEVLDVGSRVFGYADRHAKKIEEYMKMTDFGANPSDVVMLNYEMNMMGSLWQLAATMVKDMTEPLKSIVNK
ncbi:MAG TPA: hypothetical protein VFV39_01900 [Limnobacter sp.]|nr:hypothetical protein [Limnobacter sp.]